MANTAVKTAYDDADDDEVADVHDVDDDDDDDADVEADTMPDYYHNGEICRHIYTSRSIGSCGISRLIWCLGLQGYLK